MGFSEEKSVVSNTPRNILILRDFCLKMSAQCPSNQTLSISVSYDNGNGSRENKIINNCNQLTSSIPSGASNINLVITCQEEPVCEYSPSL